MFKMCVEPVPAFATVSARANSDPAGLCHYLIHMDRPPTLLKDFLRKKKLGAVTGYPWLTTKQQVPALLSLQDIIVALLQTSLASLTS